MFATLLLAAAVGYAHPEQLVDTSWVASHAQDANVRLLDMRRSGFDDGHIPRAVWLDPESIRDSANPPTFMMKPETFEQLMGRLGISHGTTVILYDDRGGLLASRLWWMLNAYGHSNVALVNGGWLQWTMEKRPTVKSASPVKVATFKASPQPQWLATADDVQAAIGKPNHRILDARTVAEMDGTDTRLSSRGGVIPSAIPVYWEDLLDPVNKTFKSPEDLRAIYDARGIKPSDEVIAYCWVGHRSAVDLFTLHLIGYEHLRNYLGSWEEWSKRLDLPTAPFTK
jgi:thiosulfate/3-mercaptopyruvate sulfurtransferase